MLQKKKSAKFIHRKVEKSFMEEEEEDPIIFFSKGYKKNFYKKSKNLA